VSYGASVATTSQQHAVVAVDCDAPPIAADLAPTTFLDADSNAIERFVYRVTVGAADRVECGVRLYEAVRDGIRYDPTSVSLDPSDHRASAVLAGSQRWCVPKAVLLAASCRAAGIPARLWFADVRNHLQPPGLSERMGTDLFVWHGYAVLWLAGGWRKASPAFNRELCARFGTAPLDFDGRSDALLHAFDGGGRRHMEYVRQRGIYRDLPLDAIRATFADVYSTATLDRG
jgi:transglutaminase-like putative cysteine protease